MLSRIQLRQFLAVVDMGNFTRAAHSLVLAQASLSAGIAELERQLGTRLFVRERRRIGLTAAGNALLPLARTIERDFHRVESQVGNLPAPVRPIKLGILDSVPSGWIASALAAYAGSEPLELLEGNERELRAALGTGAIDLALTLCNPDDRQFQAEPLLAERYLLALPDTHPLAGAAEIDPSEVAGETMIARRSCEVLAETSRFFTERGIRPRFSLRSANDDRVMALVGAGLGVTVAPHSLGRAGIAMVALRGFERDRRIGLLLGEHWTAQYGLDHGLLTALRDHRPLASSAHDPRKSFSASELRD